MTVSLITTVLNEQKSIKQFLASVARQVRQPDEIVIVDGGSVDKTTDIIMSFAQLNINLIKEKSNIAHGRNLAIESAKHDIIAVTDAGCTLATDWLQIITEPFRHGADVVVGNYKINVRSFFDACQYSFQGLFKSGTNLNDFVISSRSLAFKKRVWDEIGGYPEWLNFSEDMYFHTKFMEGNYKIEFAKDAVVEWNMRENLTSLFWQFFRYMEGDGMAAMHTKRHILRFSTYAIGFLLIILSIKISILFTIPLFAGAVLYLMAPFSKFYKLKSYRFWGRAVVALPLMLLLIDGAKMAGYLSGLIKRVKGFRLQM